MMNKKCKNGSVFAVGMTLVTIFLIGYSWYCFLVVNNKINSGVVALDNLTSIYQASERLSFYLEDASKLSAHQAFYELAKKAAIEGEICFTKPYNNQNIVQWNELCKPDNELSKKLFLNEYNKSFTDFIKNYPEKIQLEFSTALENNTIVSTIKKTLQTEQQATYAKYNLSYEMFLKPETNLKDEQIYLEDFLLIYNTLVSKIDECKKEKIELKACLEKLSLFSFERWNFNATQESGWILFEFKTKNSFFFKDNGEEKFSNIKLNFGLSY